MSSRTFKAIIVDDEKLARVAVRSECERFDSIDVIAESSNGFEAVKAITELSPDIVFLDVQMPKLSGFEVLELVQGDFAVIFVTAHDDFALKAFDAQAIDYLLKPFSPERFNTAINKAIDSLQAGRSGEDRQKGAKLAQQSDMRDRVLVRDGTNVHVLPLAQISHIEAQDDYIAIIANGTQYLKQQTMASIDEQLPSQQFVRVHRSSIINLDYLAKIELYAKDSRVAILKDGTKVNVSRSGYEKLKGYLQE